MLEGKLSRLPHVLDHMSANAVLSPVYAAELVRTQG